MKTFWRLKFQLLNEWKCLRNIFVEILSFVDLFVGFSHLLPDVREFCLPFKSLRSLHMTRRKSIKFHYALFGARETRENGLSRVFRRIVQCRNWKPQRIQRGEWWRCCDCMTNHEQPWQWKMISEILHGFDRVGWRMETFVWIKIVKIQRKFQIIFKAIETKLCQWVAANRVYFLRAHSSQLSLAKSLKHLLLLLTYLWQVHSNRQMN